MSQLILLTLQTHLLQPRISSFFNPLNYTKTPEQSLFSDYNCLTSHLLPGLFKIFFIYFLIFLPIWIININSIFIVPRDSNTMDIKGNIYFTGRSFTRFESINGN